MALLRTRVSLHINSCQASSLQCQWRRLCVLNKTGQRLNARSLHPCQINIIDGLVQSYLLGRRGLGQCACAVFMYTSMMDLLWRAIGLLCSIVSIQCQGELRENSNECYSLYSYIRMTIGNFLILLHNVIANCYGQAYFVK